MPLSAAARERRSNLAAAVEKIVIAVQLGDVVPETLELEALALLCDDAQLPEHAARIRRWLA